FSNKLTSRSHPAHLSLEERGGSRMRGRKPLEYRLREGDRQYLQAMLADGQLIQRVASRARALLALDRGERIGEIAHWLGWSRTGLWDRLQPHRSRYWKTATIDERFVTQAAKILWRYERVEWLYARDEVVLCVDEKPHMQVLVRLAPTQSMHRGQIARREFEYTRDGTVTF